MLIDFGQCKAVNAASTTCSWPCQHAHCAYVQPNMYAGVYRCYRRNVMDVRFERVAEAVAAMHDFEHLALMSSKQTVRPRACKVVLKPVTFECGAYTAAATDTTTTATSTVYRHQQQELAQPLRQQPLTVMPETEPVPTVVTPTATAAAATAAAAAGAAAAIGNTDNRYQPRALTPEYASTDDDTYCGTGSGTLGRAAVQRRYSKRSRSRSSSRDDSRSRSSRSRSRRYFNGSSSTRWHSSSSPQRRSSQQWS
jgi:hypothetical protein